MQYRLAITKTFIVTQSSPKIKVTSKKVLREVTDVLPTTEYIRPSRHCVSDVYWCFPSKRQSTSVFCHAHSGRKTTSAVPQDAQGKITCLLLASGSHDQRGQSHDVKLSYFGQGIIEDVFFACLFSNYGSVSIMAFSP